MFSMILFYAKNCYRDHLTPFSPLTFVVGKTNKGLKVFNAMAPNTRSHHLKAQIKQVFRVLQTHASLLKTFI